ncbi:MAG TPA: hypothetical protein PKH07_18700, partial [bacterium]|nr:hypothetical protein [bacterium]
MIIDSLERLAHLRFELRDLLLELLAGEAGDHLSLRDGLALQDFAADKVRGSVRPTSSPWSGWMATRPVSRTRLIGSGSRKNDAI